MKTAIHDMESKQMVGISTAWSLWQAAHDAAPETRQWAQRQLLDRYSGAIRRYLRAAVRDAQAADDLFHEFAVRFLDYRLRGANARRGRLRDFLRGVLFRLIAEHHDRRRPLPLTAELRQRAIDTANSKTEAKFDTRWRDELLARSWLVLREDNQALYEVLRFRSEVPALRAPQIAEQLSQRFGKTLTPAGVRHALHRARAKFSAFLLEEIADSLRAPTVDNLERELIELGLLEQCRPALDRRRRRYERLLSA